MKNLLIAIGLLFSVTLNAQIQYGGQIKAQNNAAVIGNIQRTNDNLKVIDSALNNKIPQLTLVGTGLKVDGSSVVQPTSLSTDADNTASGTLGAAAQTVVLITSSKSAGSITISGTWAGTITFEASNDGTIWNLINAVASSTSYPQPTTTVNGLYRLTPGGVLQIRANMTAFTSGSASISMRASLGTAGIFANQILPTRITDGANTASIKPASTSSATTDLPLIVALHPSSPTPNFLLAQTVTGTRLNNGTSNSSGSTHLTIGGSDGTNLKPLLVDVGGRPIVKLSDGTNSVGITAAGIAGSEITVDRLKVNASLRLLDVAQAAGSQLVAAKGDQTTGLWVNVKNTTLPVTGSFFQTTQPVSIASMPTTPVTGTFFQTTQPVSLVANTPVIATGTNKIGSVDISGSVPITTATAAALNADLVPAIDVSAYKSVTVQVLGTYSGTLTFQGCNDNVNFLSTMGENIGVVSSALNTTTTFSNVIFHIPVKFKFFRVRMTAFTSGSATSVAIAYTDDRQVSVTSVAISPGTAVALSPGTSAIGTIQPKGINVNGNTMSSLNSAATTNATLVKASAATVYTITIMNTSAANRFVRIYNLTTAPTVGTSIPIMVIAVPATSSKELEFGMGIPFSTGLSYAITGGAAATDATVVAAGDVQFTISWN